MKNKKEFMLEVFSTGKNNLYKIFSSKYLESYSKGYKIVIPKKRIIIHDSNILERVKYFVNCKICTLEKFEEVMRYWNLYDDIKHANVSTLKKLEMIGVVVNSEENIPIYFCVHRDMVREYSKSSLKIN